MLHPLRRVGGRGEGRFERVSWDDALAAIADAMLDAIEEQGPESILTLLTPEPGAAPARLFANALGTPTTDGNAEFQDFSPGWHVRSSTRIRSRPSTMNQLILYRWTDALGHLTRDPGEIRW